MSSVPHSLPIPRPGSSFLLVLLLSLALAAGWVQAQPGQEDYVIAQRMTPVSPAADVPQALFAGRVAGRGNQSPVLQNAGSGGIHDGNFRISQAFSSTHVLSGGSVEVQLRFDNISSEGHQNLWVDIYFVLEESSLVSAPPFCSQRQVDGGPVLSCELGNFAPGQSRAFSYTVKAASRPGNWLISTALVGRLQHDAYVPIVIDVLSDSDGDGISDFNERLLGSNEFNANSVDHGETIIDVMTLFTRDAEQLYQGQPEVRINQLISRANQIYADSGVGIILRPVYQGPVDYPEYHDMERMLEALTAQSHPAFADVATLRQRYGADLVLLLRPQRQEAGRCGLANLGGYQTNGDFTSFNEKDYAYSLLAIDCPLDSVLAHELGHNMGLTHSRREDGGGGTFPYATGYGVDAGFATVMAHPDVFHTERRLDRFSSPQLDCLGQPCGVVHDDSAQGADAVRSLNLVRHQIGSYYPAQVPFLPARAVAAASGRPLQAIIAGAITTRRGLRITEAVSPGEVFEVSADFRIDEDHVGKEGYFHVLVALGEDQYLAVTESGLAEQFWDGSLAGLPPFLSKPTTLGNIEFFRSLNGLQIDAAHSGRRVAIYLAYSLVDGSELVYTSEPLHLRIL